MFKVCIVILLLLVIYTIYDNNRIVITEESVMIDNLPAEFENFTILQISDLHEKEFGRNQSKLINKINHIDYDVIVFTGDILEHEDSRNYESFYTLLDGIDNKDNMLYIPGNSDPPSYQVSPFFDKSEFIKGMEAKGVRFLEAIDTIQVKEKEIHFLNFELAIIKNPEMIGKVNGTVRSIHATNEKYQAYQSQLWDDLTNSIPFNSPDAIFIALNHYPVVDARMDYIKNDPATKWKDFDLIIAGHYHGGQIRLPFIGALFVPEAWYEPNRLFPPRDRVKGLWEYEQTKQYVSAGLGSSKAVSFLNFRLFNTPEINVLKLK